MAEKKLNLVPRARTRKLTIVAQDPAVKDKRGRILTAEVEVPAEELARGPLGYRVHVIDYDGSTRTLYGRSSTAPPRRRLQGSVSAAVQQDHPRRIPSSTPRTSTPS